MLLASALVQIATYNYNLTWDGNTRGGRRMLPTTVAARPQKWRRSRFCDACGAKLGWLRGVAVSLDACIRAPCAGSTLVDRDLGRVQ
jgi:hypothetical protein